MVVVALNHVIQLITSRGDVQDMLANLFPNQVPDPSQLANPTVVRDLLLWCAASHRLEELKNAVLQLLLIEATSSLEPIEPFPSPIAAEQPVEQAAPLPPAPQAEQHISPAALLLTGQPSDTASEADDGNDAQAATGSLTSVCAVDPRHPGKVGEFYRAIVCTACKCFFYRHVRDQRKGIVRDANPARYEACLRAGMDPKAVMVRYDCVVRGSGHDPAFSSSSNRQRARVPSASASASTSASAAPMFASEADTVTTAAPPAVAAASTRPSTPPVVTAATIVSREEDMQSLSPQPQRRRKRSAETTPSSSTITRDNPRRSAVPKRQRPEPSDDVDDDLSDAPPPPVLK